MDLSRTRLCASSRTRQVHLHDREHTFTIRVSPLLTASSFIRREHKLLSRESGAGSIPARSPKRHDA